MVKATTLRKHCISDKEKSEKNNNGILFLQILSSIILMLSSFLFVSRRFYELRSLWIFSAGRFLAGLANGLAYLAVIVQAAENAVNQIRGVILRFIGYMLAFSLFIAGFTTNGSIENDINSECIMGYLTLFYSVLALIAAPLLTIESVPFILQQTNDGRSRGERESLAIETMIRLRNEKGETAKIRYDLDEIKHQLIEDELDSRNPFGHKNCRPLIIVIGVRVLSVCAKNLPFTILIMGYFNKLVNPETFSLYALLLLLSCRFIFGILAMFFIDKFERKKYLYVSSIICGALLFITMVIVFRQNDDENIFDASYCSYGIILFYILASMSIDCVGHVQTSEAFSYATKIWSIVIASCVEHLVHIFLIILFQLQWDTWAFIVTAVGLIVMGHSTLLTVPAKTKGLSLRQTRDIYRAVAHNVNIN